MARTTVMTLQTIWDCQWSRPARPAGVMQEPLDGLWVCVRPQGNLVRRPVIEEECAACPHWQATLSEEE
jgi:hypothetical protein